MFSEDLCCEITQSIVAEDNCEKLPGGIDNVRIACLKYFESYTEIACTAAANPGTISAIVATDPVAGTPVVPFYNIGIKRKTGEHIFGLSYDRETDTVTRTGTVNFEITAFDDQTLCAINEYIGQEVVLAFQYRGSERWYLEGWKGGLYVQNIEGGSGLDSARNTNFVITGDDLEALFVRFFDTDDATTTTAIEALTN